MKDTSLRMYFIAVVLDMSGHIIDSQPFKYALSVAHSASPCQSIVS